MLLEALLHQDKTARVRSSFWRRAVTMHPVAIAQVTISQRLPTHACSVAGGLSPSPEPGASQQNLSDAQVLAQACTAQAGSPTNVLLETENVRVEGELEKEKRQAATQRVKCSLNG